MTLRTCCSIPINHYQLAESTSLANPILPFLYDSNPTNQTSTMTTSDYSMFCSREIILPWIIDKLDFLSKNQSSKLSSCLVLVFIFFHGSHHNKLHLHVLNYERHSHDTEWQRFILFFSNHPRFSYEHKGQTFSSVSLFWRFKYKKVSSFLGVQEQKPKPSKNATEADLISWKGSSRRGMNTHEPTEALIPWECLWN